MNEMPMKQNSEPFLRLLRARTQIYDEARRLQAIQFVFTVIIPILAGAAGLYWDSIRPYVAAGALLIAILDVGWLDRSQRSKLRLAAKISERFDCELFGLEWNRFASGKQADPETIEAAATRYKGDQKKLLDWYPAIVGRAPLYIARIVCQRTNLWYDGSLRRKFAKFVVACATVLLLVLAVLGVAAELKLLDFVATVLTPAAPVLIWALRENFRQSDAADAIEFQKSEAESLFDSIKAGTCDEKNCYTKSREFQDAIYARRCSNPMIFPLIYKFSRPKMESQMVVGADEFLRSLGV